MKKLEKHISRGELPCETEQTSLLVYVFFLHSVHLTFLINEFRCSDAFQQI